jgi:hypothetical protein
MLLNQESMIESSHIDKAMYDFTTKSLKIRFKSGAVYEYSNVEPSVYESFIHAESQGKFFNEKIKNTYSHNQLLTD